jgi:hypothetical protein
MPFFRTVGTLNYDWLVDNFGNEYLAQSESLDD